MKSLSERLTMSVSLDKGKFAGGFLGDVGNEYSISEKGHQQAIAIVGDSCFVIESRDKKIRVTIEDEGELIILEAGCYKNRRAPTYFIKRVE